MIEVLLQYPISVNGQLLNRLTMRRPKVRDRMLSEQEEGSPSVKEVKLMALLCNIPSEAVAELDMADYLRLQTALADFLVEKPAE